MKKLLRKVTLAIVTTLLLVVTMTTSTFAWISMINQVKADGMKFRVDAPDTIYIATTNSAGEYTDSITFNVDAVKLYPVSSVNGADQSFYAPQNLKKVSDNGTLKDGANVVELSTVTGLSASSQFNGLYDGLYTDNDNSNDDADEALKGAQAYAEYVFYLKAVPAGDADKKVYLNYANLTYTGTETTNNGINAFRYAIILENQTTTVTTLTVSGGNYGVGAMAAFTNKAYPAASNVLTDIAALQNDLFTAKVGEDNIVKVTVRIWLDGEDTTYVYNKYFAKLTSDYAFELRFGYDSTTVSNHVLTNVE